MEITFRLISLLIEVFLLQANKLPSGKHSVFGIGAQQPDPEDVATIDDDGREDSKGSIKVPWGKQKTSGAKRTTLNYNEYIVYDTKQIRLKYLVKLKFLYDDFI